MKKTAAKKGNPELIEALNAIEKEKGYQQRDFA